MAIQKKYSVVRQASSSKFSGSDPAEGQACHSQPVIVDFAVREFGNSAQRSVVVDPHGHTALFGPEICEFLGYYTVRLSFLREDQNFDKAGVGTGVLVNIGDKYFILTAGHCAKEYQSGKTAIGITKQEPHRFTPQVGRCNFRYDEKTSIDFGYIEIPNLHKGNFSSRAKLFMNSKRILVETSEQLHLDKDRMVVAGYPDSMSENSQSTSHGTNGYKFFYNSTIIAGTGTAPRSTIPRAAADMQTVDLSIASTDQVDTISGRFDEFNLPRFSGMSGGGCWRSCCVSGTDWQPSHMKLIGIHIGSDHAGVFAREVLIGHHIRLIAEDFHDLAPLIYETWPALTAAHWATGI